MTETGPATALPERETGARRAAWLACLPWLAVLGTYGVCLALYAAGKSHHFFYFDEWIYVENADRDRLEHLFRPYFWYFHPISWRLYFVALFRRFGPDPAVFLTAQVALIWIAATLVHVVVHRVSGRHALGFLANLLYVGASATATDAYWKSCIAYPVAACFEVAFLACVLELMLVRARAGAVVLATAAAIAAYACAWMSRNNAIVLPFALVVLWGAGRHRWANGALLVTIAAAIASLLWYRFDLSPGAAGSVEVARTYRPANVVASWWAIFFGPPWRVDSELLSFIPGMRWGYAPLIPSRVILGRLLVLGAVLASLPALFRRAAPRPRFLTFLFAVTAIQLTTAAPFVRDTPSVDRVLYEPAITLSTALALSVGRLLRAVGSWLPSRRAVGSRRPLAWGVAACAAGGGMIALATRMSGFGGAGEPDTRRWECLWRQLQNVEHQAGFRPVVIDRSATGTVGDDLIQFLAMARLGWAPIGVGGARFEDAVPARPDTLRIFADQRVYFVDMSQPRHDLPWAGPAACPLPVPSIAVDVVFERDRDHDDDALALPDPQLLARFATASLEELRRGMHGAAWRDRLLSTSFLGLRGPEQVPALAAALASEHWYVREAAAQAIAAMGDAALPVVRAQLDTAARPLARELAVRILSELAVQSPAARDQIARWFGHADPWVRAAAERCWDRSRPPRGSS
ncbi:MAG: hypothetical protein U0610_32840 [bacterium]